MIRNPVTRIPGHLALLAAILLSPAAAQAAPPPNCTEIAAVPYVISAPGPYCLASNLSYAATGSVAIRIDADGVELDLGGFLLDGRAAGGGTLSFGILASSRGQITIRNGIVRGFFYGIDLDGSSATTRDNLVENVLFEDNRYAALRLGGEGAVARRNRISRTGGTTLWGGWAEAFGILVTGRRALIADNEILDTYGQGTGPGVGVQLSSHTDGTVVEGNRIGNGLGSTTSYGISTTSQATNVLVVDNRLTRLAYGVFFSGGATGKYRDNLTSGCTTAYTGGTSAGNNN